MDNNKEKPSGGVDIAKYFDRDTKLAYVEQINSGKMTVTEAVNDLGCSRSTIYLWIKKLSEDGEQGLVAKARRKTRATTNSNHDHPVAPNLLDRQFDVQHPNEAWVMDITYLVTSEGWLYLAIVIDLYSRMVVG